MVSLIRNRYRRFGRLIRTAETEMIPGTACITIHAAFKPGRAAACATPPRSMLNSVWRHPVLRQQILQIMLQEVTTGFCGPIGDPESLPDKNIIPDQTGSDRNTRG